MKMRTSLLFMLVLMLLSCKQEEALIDPCSWIEVDLKIINQTTTDLGIETILLGCSVEINPSGQYIASGPQTPANQTKIANPGGYGAKLLIVGVVEGGVFLDSCCMIQKEITENNQQFNVRITFDGTYYKAEFL